MRFLVSCSVALVSYTKEIISKRKGKKKRSSERNGIIVTRCLLYAKEMMFKGKDGSTSVFRNLTNGLAWADMENNVSGARASGSKG